MDSPNSAPLFRYYIYQYLRLAHLSQSQFEELLQKEVVFGEVADYIDFFRKEIFPLKTETVKWCYHYFDKNENEVNYNTILKEINFVEDKQNVTTNAK